MTAGQQPKLIYYAHPMRSSTNATTERKDLFKRALIALGHHMIDPSLYGLKDGDDDREIVQKNMKDIMACDCFVADFTAPSSGVAMEAMFARVVGKPIFGIVLLGVQSAWVSHMCKVMGDEDAILNAIKFW